MSLVCDDNDEQTVCLPPHGPIFSPDSDNTEALELDAKLREEDRQQALPLFSICAADDPDHPITANSAAGSPGVPVL